jgi:FkbM family methyltransferase
MQVFTTPSGLQLFHNSLDETKYVYREIFEEKVYFRHGINIFPSETIFDIGANIGLFTVYLLENYTDLKIHAFEPSPPTYQYLKANAAKYGNSVHTHMCGLSDKSGIANFTHYPNYSIMSGFEAQAEQDKEILKRGIMSQMEENNVNQSDLNAGTLDRLARLALGQRQEFQCELRTISEIIDENSIESIGLLKVDAEGSEAAILSGIDDRHWKLIRQIAMEIHDPEGTVREIIANKLTHHGFNHTYEEERRLAGSGVINCYAVRA